MAQSHLLYRFSEVDADDRELVGEKGAQLGEMIGAGFPVPDGFIIATSAYFQFLKENGLQTKITHLLGTVNFSDPVSILQVSSHIQTIIRQGTVSSALHKAITSSYLRLGGTLSEPTVAIRSSLIRGDFPPSGVVGTHETYLNIRGEAAVLVHVKDIWASLFNPKTLFYRHKKKFDHFQLGVAVIIQQMIAAEASGIMFTVSPRGNDKSLVCIQAIYGVGELLSEGKIKPDSYTVNKNTLEIAQKSITEQTVRLERIRDELRTVPVDKRLQHQQKLSDKEIQHLAELGKNIERHYYFPQKIHWAKSRDHFLILQTRVYEEEAKTGEENISQPIMTGNGSMRTIVSGAVRIVSDKKDLASLTPGEIVVTKIIDPRQSKELKKAGAIISEKQLARYQFPNLINLPLISGVKNATKLLKTGSVITLNGKTGEIHKGGYLTPLSRNKRISRRVATKLYASIHAVNAIEKTLAQEADGVGILSGSSLIKTLGIHPKKMLRDGKGHEYTQNLAQEIAKVCIPFSPDPVIYCASDLTSSDYRELIGGKSFEPTEPNPLLGFRGATRYIHDPETFALELNAIRHVREALQGKNLWLMIPYVRTPAELFSIKKLLLSHGLQRSSSFKVWLMLQIPGTVIRLEEFLKIGLDGVMIGADDLSMLFLGTDKKNPEVAHVLDEENEALLQSYHHIINICTKNGIPAVFSDTTSSLNPTLIDHLIQWGVTGVSVPPDAIENVRKTIYKYERKLIA